MVGQMTLDLKKKKKKDEAILEACGNHSRKLAAMMFVTCLRTFLSIKTRPLCVPREFEQCFVNASCMTGWHIHLSSSTFEAAFELERLTSNYRNKSSVELLRFITSNLYNETRKTVFCNCPN